MQVRAFAAGKEDGGEGVGGVMFGEWGRKMIELKLSRISFSLLAGVGGKWRQVGGHLPDAEVSSFLFGPTSGEVLELSKWAESKRPRLCRPP